MVKDYYHVLGVTVEAKTDEIKKAYRLLAKICHPDVRPGEENPEAQKQFEQITEAYEVLVDPARRKKYDQMTRMRWKTPVVSGPGPGARREAAVEWTATTVEAEPEPARATPKKPEPVSRPKRAARPMAEPVGRAPREPRRFDPPGSPAGSGGISAGRGGRILEVVVSFETAMKGGMQVMTVPMEEKCEKCGGTGSKSKRGILVCPGCEGRGHLAGSGAPPTDSGKCPRCDGRGTLVRERCTRCQGSGWSRKDRKIAVRVEPGEEDGTRRPLSEVMEPAGDVDPGGIQVEFRVREHPFFCRRGLDIVCEAPIDLATAIRGGNVAVRTVLGKRVLIKVPAGTDGGTTFRVQGEGIRKGDRTGNQLVTVKIVTPKRLSDKASEYLDLFLRESRR